MPGVTLRAITSPSMGARSVYSCVTESAPPPLDNSAAFFCARDSSAFAFW